MNHVGIHTNQKLKDTTMQEYQRLGNHFLDLTEYIPLAEDRNAPNYRFGSPQVAAFGIDCCTWLETLLEELLHDSRFDGCPDIEKYRANKNPDMKLYRDVFEKHLNFSNRACRLKHFRNSQIRPFESWEEGDNPEWFRIYSRDKHNRLVLAESFTMGHALKAFAAVSVVLNEMVHLGGGWGDDHMVVFDAILDQTIALDNLI